MKLIRLPETMLPPCGMKSMLALVLFISLLLTARAQVTSGPRAQTFNASPELYQALLDLTNPWTVMCVAAHPDDEDGATLILLRRKYGVHTVTLFSTYGEGGQNAIGPELYDELGLIRARETLKAAAIQGSEAHFLGLRDFGFSKSADEAFRIWGHDEALRRMVLKIRQLRPDVIITNHDTSSGHGHHQATGRLVQEAFGAAADPARFPEQLRGTGLSVWQASRLFVRVGYEGGGGSPAREEGTAREVVSVDPNERDEVRGQTYAEQALLALQQHASQGPWPQAVPAAGARIPRYRLTLRSGQSTAWPTNGQTFLDGLALPQKVSERLTPLASRAILPLYTGNRFNPQGILGALISLRRAGLFSIKEAGDEAPRFRLMNERLDRALALASGIRIKLSPREDVFMLDATNSYAIRMTNNGEKPARLERVVFRLDQPSTSIGLKAPAELQPGASVNLMTSYNLQTPPGLSAQVAEDLPYVEKLASGLLFDRELKAVARVELEGASFTVEDTARVPTSRALEILSVRPALAVLTPATLHRPQTFIFRLLNHRRLPFEGFIGSGNREARSDATATFRLRPGEARDVRVTLPSYLFGRPGGGTNRPSLPFPKGVLRMVWSGSSSEPAAHYTIPTVYADARLPQGLRVGYVRSSDFTLPHALAALGVEAKELTPEEIQAGELKGYDTIIIDNRGYQAHPDLVAANARLLDYARQGGTLIVFYHKTNEWNPDPQKSRPQLAPYAITLGNSRVTDENATVSLTESQHALLNWPNKLGAEDFQGWIQERGLYYPSEWDEHYSAPLLMNDAGEPPLRGGLLATAYGRGHYIYTSIVWYRQLRAGVPGAYRALANMISFGHEQKR